MPRGRKPKPKDDAPNSGPAPSNDRPVPPTDLTPQERKVFNALADWLEKRGASSGSYGYTIANTAETWCRWLRCKRDIAEHGDFDVMPNGIRILSPAVKGLNIAERQLRANLRELGLTPASFESITAKDPDDELDGLKAKWAGLI